MKIAFLDDWLDCARSSTDWSDLASAHQLVFFNDTVTGPALAERLYPFDIVCCMRERSLISADLLDNLPNLKLLVTSGMRNAAIDLDAAAKRGLPVSGTDIPGHATAELTMTLIGMLARQLLPAANAMATGGWQTHLGRDLRGARLGILGLGRLGSQLAGLARPFGMEIQAWSQNLTAARCAEANVKFVDKDTLFASSDFISIHLKLSDRVTGLVGARELGLMKPSAYLINSSRAPIVDMPALGKALQSGQLAGAALDVYDLEPLPADDPMRSWPNLLLTPHIGYVTEQTMQIFHSQMAENIRAFLDGAPIRLMSQ